MGSYDVDGRLEECITPNPGRRRSPWIDQSCTSLGIGEIIADRVAGDVDPQDQVGPGSRSAPSTGRQSSSRNGTRIGEVGDLVEPASGEIVIGQAGLRLYGRSANGEIRIGDVVRGSRGGGSSGEIKSSTKARPHSST